MINETLNPEERTKLFFTQPLENLHRQLLEGEGQVIAIPDTNKKIRLTDIQSFSKVGRRWNVIATMQPGDLWNPQYIKTVQSLVRATGTSEDVGACIRLKNAEYFDPKQNIFVDRLRIDGTEYNPKEPDIAKYLGLTKNMVSKLKFLDDSNTLYIVREDQMHRREVSSSGEITLEQANTQLGKLLDNG